jgi:hypothetical protein
MERDPAALEELVITFGFRSDGVPDGSYESVPAGVGTVYAAARVSGVSAGQVVSAIVTDAWGNELARPSVTIDPGAADRWLALPIPVAGNVPSGEYGVYIEIDGQVVGSLAFGITAPGSSAQLLPEAPTNVQIRATLPPPGATGVQATGTADPSQNGQQGQGEQPWEEQQPQVEQPWQPEGQWQQEPQGEVVPDWQQNLPDGPWQNGQAPPGWGQDP